MPVFLFLLFLIVSSPVVQARDGGADLPVQILLQDSPLAGFQFHAGRDLWPRLAVGNALTLVREADNPHDTLAVRVDWHGVKLGYVPRRENAAIARLLDGGQPLWARISRLTDSPDPWARIRFEILMPLPGP
jgi:hypothetical protein